MKKTAFLTACSLIVLSAIPKVSTAQDDSDIVDVQVRPYDKWEQPKRMALRAVMGRPASPMERVQSIGEPMAGGALVGSPGGPYAAGMGAAYGALKGGYDEAKKEVKWVVKGGNE